MKRLVRLMTRDGVSPCARCWWCSRRRFDPSGTVDGTFKVWLFWIVSRANNCHYCMGHQELKLRGAGLADDEIAALDCDWSGFPANQRVAMELARKMTNTPCSIPLVPDGGIREAF